MAGAILDQSIIRFRIHTLLNEDPIIECDETYLAPCINPVSRGQDPDWSRQVRLQNHLLELEDILRGSQTSGPGECQRTSETGSRRVTPWPTPSTTRSPFQPRTFWRKRATAWDEFRRGEIAGRRFLALCTPPGHASIKDPDNRKRGVFGSRISLHKHNRNNKKKLSEKSKASAIKGSVA